MPNLMPDWYPSEYLPHIPTAPQLVFLSLPNREALYGGAAGGGKSDALLMDGLAWVQFKDYDGLIVRKTYRDLALSGAIMDRARTWLDPFVSRGVVHWDSLDHRFKFPSGARLQFGYLGDARDRYRYMSAEYQFVGIDEATQFEEADYTYLLSRNRRTKAATVPGVKMRLASNPGGIGHDWCRRRFLPWVDDDGHTVYPCREDGERRVFVPAKLWDNPHINADEYAANLRELDPVTCSQLLNGDWGARPPGEMFDRRWYSLDGEELVSRAARWVRAWDLAGTKKRSAGHDPDFTVGTLMGVTPTSEVVVWDVIRKRDTAGAIEDLIIQTAQADKARFGSVALRIEQEPGSSGKYVAESYARKLLGYDFEAVPATGAKSLRAVPFSKASKAGLVHLRDAPWTGDWLSEFEAFPQESTHDDQVDASSLAFQTLTQHSPAAGGTVEPSRTKSPYDAPRRSRL